jgi:hypothetical protein
MFDVLINIRMFPLAKRKQDRGEETVAKEVNSDLTLPTWRVFTRTMHTHRIGDMIAYTS